jgi:predicted dehydrogenase
MLSLSGKRSIELNVILRVSGALLLGIFAASTASAQRPPARLVVLDPGHFHATLLQKEMYPELDPKVSVYAPLGPDLLDYLNRISLFNARAASPTQWELDVHTSSRPLEEMLQAKAGGRSSIVVLSGRNRNKIDRILKSLDAGYNVLADKPWIIASRDLPRLEQALDRAPQKGLAAYDIMTERYEVTEQVLRALVAVPDIYGQQVPGDAAHPAIRAVSVHHLMKNVAGVPLRRPVWFFDSGDNGEGLADVGTHPVDLIQWVAFPDQLLDYRKDIQMLSGRHDAVRITKEQFAKVTGAADFPKDMPHVHDGVLDYYCNNYIEYALRGVRVKLDVLWKWEAAPGTGDTYEASFQGSRARVELRQSAADKFQSEVYVIPAAAERAKVFAALDREMTKWQSRWPGVAVSHSDTEAKIRLPEKFRVGHEEHFAQVVRHFFDYMKDPGSMPKWERAYMLAKYYVTTKGVEMAK